MFANATHDQYQRVTPKGAAPALLAGGPFPIAVAEDNHLYYANSALNGHLQIMRLRPNGETFVVADIPDNPKEKKLRTVNAIAAGPGDAIYLAGNHTVRRVTQQGAVTAVAGPLNNPECAALPGIKKGWRPYLQGLAVDTGGTIYAAAAGCGAVFKIAPDGSVSTIHKIVAPWTPTGIALSKGEVYVLEYSYSTSKKSKEWLPRVEKIAADGSATVIATVKR